MTVSVPPDRAGTFDPKLIAKYQRRFPDFDYKIVSMYARGMTVREILLPVARQPTTTMSPSDVDRLSVRTRSDIASKIEIRRVRCELPRL